MEDAIADSTITRLSENSVAEVDPGRRMDIHFHGKAGEYFRIWIVNTFLTLLTLGVYGAWAKVRTNRYFYRSTELDGAVFDYHANPISILIGRAILAVLLLVYFALSFLKPGSEVIVLLIAAVAAPWLFVKSVKFRMRNTSYRNIRFAFDGRLGESCKVFYLGMLATLFSAGLAYPWFDWRLGKFRIDRSRYGDARFSLSATAGRFYRVYLGALGWMLLIVGSLIGLGVLAAKSGLLNPAQATPAMMNVFAQLAVFPVLAFYLFFWTYIRVGTINAILGTTEIEGQRLVSELRVGRLFWIYVSNAIAIVSTLGLAIPWAKVRIARYRLSRIHLMATHSLAEFAAAQGEAVSATGEEIGEYMDIDLGF